MFTFWNRLSTKHRQTDPPSICRHRSVSLERKHQGGRLRVQQSAERGAGMEHTVGHLAGQDTGKQLSESLTSITGDHYK